MAGKKKRSESASVTVAAPSRAARREGKVPGVIYGDRAESAAKKGSEVARVREVRRDIARIKALASGAGAPAEIAREIGALRQRVEQLEIEQARLVDALVAEGLATPPQSPNTQASEFEPFSLPDPGGDADYAPRNLRLARLVERLRAASAEEIAARAEKAEAERLAILNGEAGQS